MGCSRALLVTFYMCVEISVLIEDVICIIYNHAMLKAIQFCSNNYKVIKTFSKNVEGCRDGSAKNHRN